MDHEDGVYEDGEDVTVTATAAEGYHFVGWKLKDSEDILSTDAKYIFTISENVELIGVFEKDEEPEQVITAEEIVRQIVADKSFATSVKKGTKKLTLPGVPENAQVEISSVNPEGIIALNGEVTAPKADTEVIVTVKVTGTDGSVSYADFKVMVEGSGEQENQTRRNRIMEIMAVITATTITITIAMPEIMTTTVGIRVIMEMQTREL